jgi:NADH dehydrogenase
MTTKPKVLIIGAGFGGLFTAQALANHSVNVVLIDKNNFHTFTPLLYQVATSALDPSEIAYPVRSIFRKKMNVQFYLGEVKGINTQNQSVSVHNKGQEYIETYDYLVLATGSVPNYSGLDDIQQEPFVLRTLQDAVRMRNHVLNLFEQAVWETNHEIRQSLLNIVVVGGGPTGLETAGAMYELYNHVLDREFLQRDMHARVILVEATQSLLTTYPKNLQRAALKQLRSLGVEVILNNRVVSVDPNTIILEDGTRIPSQTFVWSAGIKASPLGNFLSVPLEIGDRVPVERDLRVKGFENVFVIGDMNYLLGENGSPYPQMIPPAQQQAKTAARNILALVAGKNLTDFYYKDPGVMATIGRRRAVAHLFSRLEFSGLLAWGVWLVFHLMTLMGFRNRMNVFINWAWNYLTYDRSVRIILEEGLE